jgi:hypothetical protein
MIPAIIMVWAALFTPPTFKARFEPAIQHPLHSVSAARSSFCYPTICLNG